MIDFLSFFQQRRSVPPQALQEPGPSSDQIRTLLSIAARVPDHGKLVPWRFLVMQNEARSRLGEKIAEIFKADQPECTNEAIAFEHNRLVRAPLVIGIVSKAMPHVKIPEWEQVLSSGAVCMNLVVAANAMGFATCWITEWYAYDRRFLAHLGLEPHENMAGFIHIGTPSLTPSDRVRPVLDDIVTYL
jgi:nitroreductase